MCERVALLEAPRETLLAEPGPGPGPGPGPPHGNLAEAQSVSGSCSVEEEHARVEVTRPSLEETRALPRALQLLPPRSLRVALTHLAESEHAPPPHVPGRPLGATHVLRARSWGECRLRASTAPARAPLCVAEADTVEVLLRASGSTSWATAPTSPLLIPPSGAGLRALRYARLPVPQPAPNTQPAGAATAAAWVGDPVGAVPQQRCEAAALELPQPGAAATGVEGGDERGDEGGAEATGDGCGGAWSSWCGAAASALSDGEGVTLLHGAMSTARAAAVRAALLGAIPPEKRSTRVFSNMGCQVGRKLLKHAACHMPHATCRMPHATCRRCTRGAPTRRAWTRAASRLWLSCGSWRHSRACSASRESCWETTVCCTTRRATAATCGGGGGSVGSEAAGGGALGYLGFGALGQQQASPPSP